jgi:hypothetical protein
VSARQVAVKKYVVTLSSDEREQLEALIRTGKHSSRKLLRARILLKADASGVGEAWTDSQIATGLNTSVMTVARVRQQLVEEGVEGVLTPKTELRQTADIRRRQRSKTDRPGLLDAARGLRAMDPADAGGQGRRTEHCRARQRQHHRADSR